MRSGNSTWNMRRWYAALLICASMHILRNFATLNVNGINNVITQQLLRRFIKDFDIDVLFLQEVNNGNLDFISPYEYRSNPGPMNRGTAMVYRQTVEMTQILESQDGRSQSAKLGDARIINIYGPSGTQNRTEREQFFQSGITEHLQSSGGLIIAGDFNCTLNAKDQLGRENASKVLATLVRQLQLVDAWEHKYGTWVQFTFHRGASASRIDRVYVSRCLADKIYKIDVIPVAFSDHHAVVFQMEASTTLPRYGRGYWQMNTTFLLQSEVIEQFKEKWAQLLRSYRTASDKAMWWVYKAKPEIAAFFKGISYRKAADKRNTLQFYEQVLYDLNKQQQGGVDVTESMRTVKGIIYERQKRATAGAEIRAKVPLIVEEKRSFFHVAKERRNASRRFIARVQSADGRVHGENEISAEAVRHFRSRLSVQTPSDEKLMKQFCNTVTKKVSAEHCREMEAALTEADIKQAFETAKRNTSPGPDGLPYEFYMQYWYIIKKEMLPIFQAIMENVNTSASVSQGIIILIPKVRKPKSFSEFRPITLLNADYKIIMKVLANRLRTAIGQVVGDGQTCAVPGRNITHAVTVLRDAILYYERYPVKQAAILSIDFKAAFDSVRQNYIWTLLKHIGIPHCFIQWIRGMYDSATSRVLLNGYLTDAIPVRVSVRQGCPLSMSLFTLALEPLLRMIDGVLTGMTLGSETVTVRAYADDVSILLMKAEEINTVQNILTRFSVVAGMEVNVGKSALLELGAWETPIGQTWLPVVKKHTILGITFQRKFKDMMESNWKSVTNKMIGRLQDHNSRNLNVIQRVWFLNTYALSKLWYIAQILPATKQICQRIELAVGYYLWSNSLYRVKRSQLYLPIKCGGLKLTDVHSKALALLTRNILVSIVNGVNGLDREFWRGCRGPQVDNYKLTFCPQSFLQAARFIQTVNADDITNGKYLSSKALYELILERQKVPSSIELKYPTRNWGVVWRSLCMKTATLEWKAVCYYVINELVPTGEKRHRHGMAESAICDLCSLNDNMNHRLTRCNGVDRLWKWTIREIQRVTRIATPKIDDLITLDFKVGDRMQEEVTRWYTLGTMTWIVTHRMQLEEWKFKEDMTRRYDELYGMKLVGHS